jgi:hypothetical protein
MVVERGCARLAQGQRVPDKGGQGPLWGGRAVPAEECHCVTRPRGAAPRSGQHAVPGGPARSSAAEGLPAARRQPSPKLPAPEMTPPRPLSGTGLGWRLCRSRALSGNPATVDHTRRPTQRARWHLVAVPVREPPEPSWPTTKLTPPPSRTDASAGFRTYCKQF